jgi:hypothetical protein
MTDLPPPMLEYHRPSGTERRFRWWWACAGAAVPGVVAVVAPILAQSNGTLLSRFIQLAGRADAHQDAREWFKLAVFASALTPLLLLAWSVWLAVSAAPPKLAAAVPLTAGLTLFGMVGVIGTIFELEPRRHLLNRREGIVLASLVAGVLVLCALAILKRIGAAALAWLSLAGAYVAAMGLLVVVLIDEDHRWALGAYASLVGVPGMAACMVLVVVQAPSGRSAV